MIDRSVSGLDDDDMNKVLMRAPKVKDKTPNPVQVTAEQLLIDAQIHQNKDVRPAQQRIMDKSELEDYKLRKRRTFEEKVRKQKNLIGHWVKYAVWEESLQEFQRCRSIYERALEVDYKNTSLWLKYVEMEMKHKFIEHARNIWERAITYMPRVDQFWYKYSYMEEMIGQYQKSREIFQKWITWKPEEKAYLAYAKFEERMQQYQNQREVMYLMLEAHPKYLNYIRVAKFEYKNKRIQQAREVFEKGIKDLGYFSYNQDYFIAFAKFETRNKEIDRARQIFKFGLQNLSRDKSHKLYELYVNFEKQNGLITYIDDLILQKRRIHYKEILADNQYNYDVWFDIINLEQQTNDHERILQTFEAAIKQVPLIKEKRYYQRYIYLWYNYLIYLENFNQDQEQTVLKYQEIVNLIPHKQFSFSKLWIMYAQFYLRQENLDKCRKIFGQAIAKAGTEKIFKQYIEMELQLGNIERCRIIYEKYIEKFSDSPSPWINYSELETNLGEIERARSILQLAVNIPNMNMPEQIWKCYIDFEINNKEYEKVRTIYQSLLQKSKHVKVWISMANFELEQKNYQLSRSIFEQAEEYYKLNSDLKEERVLLIKAWRQVEFQIGDQKFIDAINAKMPKKVKKQRKILLVEDSNDLNNEENIRWEEYYDYIFPGDESSLKNLKILQNAYNWKKQTS